MTLTVRTVGQDRRLARAWVDVAWQRHGGDPHWVPPLRADMRRSMDRRKNPFLRQAEVEHFLLFDGRQPLGRVAATVYPKYVERHGVQAGFFGFLSCPEDPEAMRLLLEAAEQWLAARGMTRVAGPYHYFSGQEMGLLVAGFDSPPALFQTYNPPSYPKLLRQCGYRELFRAGTYLLAGAQLARVRDQVIDTGEQWRTRLGLTSRPLDPRRFRAEVELIRQLFNAAFADNHEIVPYDRDVFESLVLPLRSLLDPQLVRFVERDGEPVAFVVVAPDLNQILRRLNGSLGLTDLLRLRRLRRSVRAAVVLLIGVLPHVPVGVGPVLFSEILKAVTAGGYEAVHTTWVHEQNRSVESLISRLCGLSPQRTYTIVQRELAAT